MKILFVHDFYREPGGEDSVFRHEQSLLTAHGHQVFTYTDNNDRINSLNRFQLALSTIWSLSSYRKLLKVLLNCKPDIVHFHNTFPLISPSAYFACKKAGIPVVQSIHNPRLFCPAASFFRNNELCTRCLSKLIPWPSVLYGCYRRSRMLSLITTAMIFFHKMFKTWRNRIDQYIIFTEFYQDIFKKSTFTLKNIVIKPHSVLKDPGFDSRVKCSYALFIGRLDPEKGINTLIKAWSQLPEIPLKIRGEGASFDRMKQEIERRNLRSIEFIERLSRDKLTELIRNACFLVWPSMGYYETFGLVAIEAFACGTPVIASRIGVLTEIVKDNYSGLHFSPGDPNDLAIKVKWAWENKEKMRLLGQNARKEYEEKYTAEKNYIKLIQIYKKVISNYNN